MRKMIQGRLSVFKFESFKKYKGIAHFITTKEGWVSGSKSRFTGDRKEEYAEFRKELAILRLLLQQMKILLPIPMR